MSDAASIALITALSTLAGAGITSWLSLLTHRHQTRHQERLMDLERSGARQDQYRTERKDAYVQFINQAVRTAHAIGEMVKPDAQVSEESYLDAAVQAQERLAELYPLLALVNIEGPEEVADLADRVANALVTEGAKASKMHRDPESKPELVAASRARWQAQREFVRAARDTVATPAPQSENDFLVPARPPELAS
ncbi:hypothetical protein [Streptomyces alfalfae]|uniref:Uncharacterized protein n=1 Tax=Streptomyces alfalfae TaxID=1642299 RepID=A0A7T4TYG7_9ACTN|nr:hypothetical protein [Streptomyces alfalfae]QQC90259.1 hypothetical protein I8755_18975 [Streptomyces alfalfae]